MQRVAAIVNPLTKNSANQFDRTLYLTDFGGARFSVYPETSKGSRLFWR